MREVLRPLYEAAGDAHPGLLIQRGYPEFDNQPEAGKQRKTGHIERICRLGTSDFYTRAFQRWRTLTSDKLRFHALELDLDTRLYVGLTAGGMLETGCAISHSYGMPYIPGSSVKGIVNAYVRAGVFGTDQAEVCDALFGCEPTEQCPQGLAGAIAFHDAWWVPGSAEFPLVQEVVTSHHPDYYGSDGATPATDLDSPIPNAQIAVRGRFLFVLEGIAAWLPLGAEMLTASLTNAGIGAKTRTGYGYFRVPEAGSAQRCPWVDETIARLTKKNNAKEEETLRGKGLAKGWQALADPDLKTQALTDIRARWQAKGWWDDPPGRSARIKAIYTAE